MSYAVFIYSKQYCIRNHLERLFKNYIDFQSRNLKIACVTENINEIKDVINLNSIQYSIQVLHGPTIQGLQTIRACDQSCKQLIISDYQDSSELIDIVNSHVEPFAYIPTSIIDDVPRFYRLIETVEKRVVASTHTSSRSIVFKIYNETYYKRLDEVVLIECFDKPHKLLLVTINSSYELYGTIKGFESAYPELIRINRACIINPQYIYKIDHDNLRVHMTNGFIRWYTKSKKSKLTRLNSNQ
ncbi:LytTR family DNA-binding domain-containing protein [Staphylococcus massiliensis]|uniref:Response regulator n=1 Tax=Staphylococcus massiliensis S46 TaxID=1229783 RepID=K9B1S5_9STAP|nr:LytTR family DNA-binding domain-containing protein [Staphylococcus massiliensis]EKU47725.1 response regulator [Staphylococcus massiliensis S46]MCG3400478.1 LytTR family transcriptional regulator DNA-binding domain-containing protein [Staphylococcus massiliensis]MCG3401490.1 LytTR family transcriptional regulator DNA-binding domain-containing protein [Staphylococcus massiliensis]POA01299.1 LytTR family transcriptional regulator [Staphylococcus massiliensis CCUG 55927]